MPRKRALVLLLLCGYASALFSSCASLDRPLPHEPVLSAADTVSFCKGWERALHGNLSYVSATPDGKRFAVSTSADDGRPRGFEARLRIFNASGKLFWSRWLGQPVKGQAISADGAFVAASTYEDLLYFFNGSGKLIWKKEFLGTPVMLSKTKRILLVNDDDSDPETAFVTFDRAGRVVGAARVDRNAEPTDLSVSSDETFVAFALNPRKWQAWSPDGKLVIEGSLPGNAASIAAYSSGESSKAAYVLYSSGGHSQRLAGFDVPSGRALWDVVLDRHYLTVRALDNNGRAVLVLYGNAANGQALAAYEGRNGKELWKRAYPVPANDSSPVFVSQKSKALPALATAAINMGVEADDGKAGILHLTGLNASGAAAFDLPLDAPDGIYWYAYAPLAPALAAGVGAPGEAVLVYFRRCR